MNRVVKHAGALIAALFLLSVGDTFISGQLASEETFRAMPGNSQAISGKLPVPIRDVRELAFSVDSPHIRIDFNAAQGRLWRGRMNIGESVQTGDYNLRVFPVYTKVPEEDMPEYRIRVFEDKAHLDASYMSLIRRVLGIPPAVMVIVTLPLVLAGLGASYWLSSQQEAILARHGIVPIVKMVRRKQGWEIHFGLGRNQGIRADDRLVLLNRQLVRVGQVNISQVDADYSQAVVPFSQELTPSYWVAREG